jgi:transcription-repair coupling factor (superfamily II helicase)
MFTSLKLYVGEEFDLGKTLSILTDLGYKRQEKVGEVGDFARRGNILDLYPFTFELPIRIELDLSTIHSIKSFNPTTGVPLLEHTMVIILPLKKSHGFKTLEFKEDSPLTNIIDLNIGDYVVHTQHGIGRFLGIDKLNRGEEKPDHLVIEYDRQEKLFVPIEHINLVQKYIGFQSRKPKLCRLGTKEWERMKSRVKKGVQKYAWDLLAMQAMRMSVGGFSFSTDTEWQKTFEQSFPYEETPDQIKANLEVKQDMESPQPMDRLLCGDVGYGKTEVAMRAAFKATMDNKQVVFLVPTTILAEQHFINFHRRLTDFPINIQLLCRFKTDAEQEKIVKGLAEGTVDIVIGTHRLLSDDIKLKNLGLLIIDEEQRFGVKAKEKLKALRLTCDILTLTATPIPRTLYLSLMGAKDMSAINTPPQNRLPVKTIVVEYDEDLIRQAMHSELSRKGQVFFVHNRIEDIEKVKARICSLLPLRTRCAVAHGQMPAKLLEQVMRAFLNGEISVLICTMIIQSGIDIPNVNTLIVNNSQAFGLSDLHQLRGRVGRFNRPAYAYFLIPKHTPLDTNARKRLDAMQRFSYLGAGFNISMEDLQIRGAGNILGTQQHGFVSSVGFDLYCRLLRDTITTFKKTEISNAPIHK